MLELAQRYTEDRPVALREIAGRHGIPQPFLVQILQSLRTANLVTSTRGSGGGYRLAGPPEQVRVLDIAEAIGCGEPLPGGEPDSGKPEGDSLRSLWQRADEAARGVLGATTLEDLVQTCSDHSAAMFYI
jgi:Rrf2 family protein